MTKNAKQASSVRSSDSALSRQEQAWIERSGAIAKGDPKAPPPKAPVSVSGTFKPGAGAPKVKGK
jgi:hypothetical protein